MTATQRFVSNFYRPVPCTFLIVKLQKLLIVVARIGAVKSICNGEAPHKTLIGYSEFQVVNFGSEYDHFSGSKQRPKSIVGDRHGSKLVD